MENKEYIPEWLCAFNRSLESNCQLSFYKKCTISVISSDSSDVSTEMFDIEIFDSKGLLKLNVDIRKEIFKDISNSKSLIVNIFFPLTREKYKLICLSKTINNNLKSKFIVDKDLIFNHLEKLDNSKLSKDFINLINKFDADIDNNATKLLDNLWKELNEEEKLSFENICPDSFKTKENFIQDLDKFDSQEKVTPIDNFGVVLLIPYIIERTIYPKPQVIANTRKQNFESLYKPRKTQTKYVYWLNTSTTNNFSFKIRELNT